MIPSIYTERLVLNEFTFDDCERVELLAGHEAVARTTANIPHPYPAGSSKFWIATHALNYLKEEGATWAIRTKALELIGCISLMISKNNSRAELGYWLGLNYWNHGYTTEAAKACIDFGFKKLRLRKIEAHYILSNPASGRVMDKIGMKKEGYLRQHLMKSGLIHDVIAYGILNDEGPNKAIEPTPSQLFKLCHSCSSGITMGGGI